MQSLTLNGVGVEVLPADTTVDTMMSSKACNNNKSIDVEDAFFVCDLADVVRKMKIWKEQLPRVTPFYAVKCNEDPALLAMLVKLGASFDCASKAEIKRIVALGVSPERIIFANPCKQNSYIKYSKAKGVNLMTFDNEAELYKVKRLYPEASLVIRVLPPDDSKSQCRLGMKFGCHPRDAYSLLEVARSLDLNVVGVSFHVGSGCYDASAYSEAIRVADQVFEDGLRCGYKFDLLDIGGGYPGHYNPMITFEEITREINTALDAYFPAQRGVRVIAEPGRYFAASAFHLAVNVIARRRVTSSTAAAAAATLDIKQVPGSTGLSAQGEHYMYYVNDGVYGSFNCMLYDHQVCQAELLKPRLDCTLSSSSVWGPTCDGLDVINEKIMLPKLEIGDWLKFSNMGAYTLCAGSQFNGMPKPAVYHYMVEPRASSTDSPCSSISTAVLTSTLTSSLPSSLAQFTGDTSRDIDQSMCQPIFAVEEIAVVA